jgi:hypothetical protein
VQAYACGVCRERIGIRAGGITPLDPADDGVCRSHRANT